MSQYHRCPKCGNTEKGATLYRCRDCGTISCHSEYTFGGSGCGRKECPGCGKTRETGFFGGAINYQVLGTIQ